MLISRRAALVRGAALLAGLYGAGSAHAATTTGVAYELKTSAHCSCRACHHHAANKLFATRSAAEHHRAHPGCKCTIVRTKVSEAVWVALFGSGRRPARTSVDRRWPSTKRALRRVAQRSSSTAPHKPKRKPGHTAVHQPNPGSLRKLV